jgi:hypothetical protein
MSIRSFWIAGCKPRVFLYSRPGEMGMCQTSAGTTVRQQRSRVVDHRKLCQDQVTREHPAEPETRQDLVARTLGPASLQGPSQVGAAPPGRIASPVPIRL